MDLNRSRGESEEASNQEDAHCVAAGPFGELFGPHRDVTRALFSGLELLRAGPVRSQHSAQHDSNAKPQLAAGRWSLTADASFILCHRANLGE